MIVARSDPGLWSGFGRAEVRGHDFIIRISYAGYDEFLNT